MFVANSEKLAYQHHSFLMLSLGLLLIAYSPIHQIDRRQQSFGNGVTLPYCNFTIKVFYRKHVRKILAYIVIFKLVLEASLVNIPTPSASRRVNPDV